MTAATCWAFPATEDPAGIRLVSRGDVGPGAARRAQATRASAEGVDHGQNPAGSRMLVGVLAAILKSPAFLKLAGEPAVEQ
ncbi:MAG: hypothetical protein U1E70_15290 [Acetobacteraceae bacterium]